MLGETEGIWGKGDGAARVGLGELGEERGTGRGETGTVWGWGMGRDWGLV